MRHSWQASSVFKRWIIFNSVGAMGIAVQMCILWLLTSGFQFGYLPATGLAVEGAVLHNFFWHEHWTWADRTKDHVGGFVQRLLCFHFTNGAVSLAGNLVLMWFFAGKLRLNYMLANALAIALCSILTFAAGDRIVFQRSGFPGGRAMNKAKNTCRTLVRISLLAGASFWFGAASAKAADLHPETLAAWQTYVEAAERRMAAELSSKKGFLALDFQDYQDMMHERQGVMSGEIPVKQVTSANRIEVPDGMIQHWRGSILIPGVSLNLVFSRIENPKADDTKQEDVLDSSILERGPGQLKMYLKLQRSKIVTVVFHTEHLVRYQRYGNNQASSSSVATKIAEIERLPDKGEREKPEGHDRGFLWRMNSYWRYQQVPGGVIVECESITLSRSIPFLLEPIVRPLINSTARESMQRTLRSMRARLSPTYTSQVSRLNIWALRPVTCDMRHET